MRKPPVRKIDGDVLDDADPPDSHTGIWWVHLTRTPWWLYYEKPKSTL